jgi:hypothetical protein
MPIGTWLYPRGHILTALLIMFLTLFPFVGVVPVLLVLIYGLFQYLRRGEVRIATCPACDSEVDLTEFSDTNNSAKCPICRQNLLIQDDQRLWIKDQ